MISWIFSNKKQWNKKLKESPVNAWEYRAGTEIKKDSGLLFAGYLISAGTLAWLLFEIKKHPDRKVYIVETR